MASAAPQYGRPKKRAIALAGGGPAAGFHIGALKALEESQIGFQVWSLSCIGAWVGVYYHQLPELPGVSRAERTHAFFGEHAFRDSEAYRGFPVNKAFAPNFGAFAEAWRAHASSLQTYLDVLNVSKELPGAMAAWGRWLQSPQKWGSEGDRNLHLLNNVLALHPLTRFITSMAYLAPVNGLSNIYYPDSSFLKGIALEALDLLGTPGLDQMDGRQLDALAARYRQPASPAQARVPEIYHNAWRLAGDDPADTGELRLFNNKWLEYRSGQRAKRRDYMPITRPSLCACSALPYIEQTVKIPNDGGREYSEGALIDTVSFRNLVEDHPDLDEIWVIRIVDYRQVRRPHNLHDSLANLCEQFAAEVGENDIEMFKTHLRKSAGRIPRVVEIPLTAKTQINYRWDRDNLECGYREGRKAVNDLLTRQPALSSATTRAPAW